MKDLMLFGGKEYMDKKRRETRTESQSGTGSMPVDSEKVDSSKASVCNLADKSSYLPWCYDFMEWLYGCRMDPQEGFYDNFQFMLGLCNSSHLYQGVASLLQAKFCGGATIDEIKESMGIESDDNVANFIESARSTLIYLGFWDLFTNRMSFAELHYKLLVDNLRGYLGANGYYASKLEWVPVIHCAKEAGIDVTNAFCVLSEEQVKVFKSKVDIYIDYRVVPISHLGLPSDIYADLKRKNIHFTDDLGLYFVKNANTIDEYERNIIAMVLGKLGLISSADN